MDWDESPETHANYRQSERLELYQNTSTNSGGRKSLQILRHRRRVGSERERQEAAGKHLATSTNISA